MTSPNEIINTITEAFNAFEQRPGLEAQIKKLQDDLDLAKYEIECRAEEERKLNQRITDLYSDRDDLRNQLDEADQDVTRLNNEVIDHATTMRAQAHKIHELEIDLEAERIKNKMLLDIQAMLQLQLDDSCSLTHRLRATLTRILGEANEVLPEVKPAATFPVDSDKAIVGTIGNDSLPMVASNPVADEVVGEAPNEKDRLAGSSYTADPRHTVSNQYSEWGF